MSVAATGKNTKNSPLKLDPEAEIAQLKDALAKFRKGAQLMHRKQPTSKEYQAGKRRINEAELMCLEMDELKQDLQAKPGKTPKKAGKMPAAELSVAAMMQVDPAPASYGAAETTAPRVVLSAPASVPKQEQTKMVVLSAAAAKPAAARAPAAAPKVDVKEPAEAGAIDLTFDSEIEDHSLDQDKHKRPCVLDKDAPSRFASKPTKIAYAQKDGYWTTAVIRKIVELNEKRKYNLTKMTKTVERNLAQLPEDTVLEILQKLDDKTDDTVDANEFVLELALDAKYRRRPVAAKAADATDSDSDGADNDFSVPHDGDKSDDSVAVASEGPSQEY
jgi:hypothetical protein